MYCDVVERLAHIHLEVTLLAPEPGSEKPLLLANERKEHAVP